MTDPKLNADGLPDTLLGTAYPYENVTAMFPDGEKAIAAVANLVDMGFLREEMVLGSGEQLLSNERVIREQRGIGARLFGWFPSEEAEYTKQYTDLASKGYAVVTVHVKEDDAERRSQVAETLRKHGGTSLLYYGKRTTTTNL